VVRKEKIGSRGYVYYCSAKRDKEKMVSVLRFLDFLCLGLDLILQNYEKHTKSWEFGIYALLDMVRYHTIILCEALNWSNQKIIDCLEEIIKIFYGYLEGNIDEAKRINKVLTVLKGEAQTLIGTSLKMDLRNYKEADHPFYNIVFRDTISEMLGERTIDSIIGIRFGGASLPLLLKKHFPYASISFFEVSNYSKKTNPNGVKIPNISPSSSVLVLDDNILTGRTLEKVIRALKNQHVKEIYFGCISCSGMKRYPQMIMRNHGVVNTDVLIASCIITESQYTKIYSSKSYKNRHGVFDINKNIIQKRLRDKIMGYKL
jgi:hypoxanthine phosphoribosyltransferase